MYDILHWRTLYLKVAAGGFTLGQKYVMAVLILSIVFGHKKKSTSVKEGGRKSINFQ